MTSPFFVLYVTCLLLGRTAHITAVKTSSSLRFVSADVGTNVTLECFYEDGATVMFYWFKQTLGQKPKLMSKYYKLNKVGNFQDEFKNDPRLALETSSGTYHLKISNVQSSDSATYYCIGGYSYVFDYLESIILNVKHSDVNIRALVHQSASESIQPGGSVTLNCTVHTGTCDDGEHSVYWFKNSEESHSGLIYTHGGRNDQCERNTNTQTHTCVYNLPMKSLNLSHAGTYYCAVASCGQILFGNGTKLEFKHEEDSLVLVYILSGALAYTIILVVFLAYTIYKMLETKSCHCKDSQARSAAMDPNEEDYQDADNLHYSAIRESKVSRSKRQRDDTWTECVYFSVRQ